jgi:predicted ATP-dependent endonuclease of OLD family
MILQSVYIRFYKSFNYDFLRKYNKDVTSHFPWEMVGDKLWYPYVQITLEPDVTTIVGANESGKTHLLTAIEKGISGEEIEGVDFCRHSTFFSVQKGSVIDPQFGFHWSNISDQEWEALAGLFKIPVRPEFTELRIFRTSKVDVTAYVGNGAEPKSYKLSEESITSLPSLLPKPFRIDPKVVLPNSIPIHLLLKEVTDRKLNTFEMASRKKRYDALEALAPILADPQSFLTEDLVKHHAAEILKSMQVASSALQESEELDELQRKSLGLANDLICLVGEIDASALATLYSSLKEGKDANAEGLIERINKNLAKNLNFSKWWGQDQSFSLSVSARDQDLVFTVRDRTNTPYSFDERSSGLRNFLSYYIQYRAHKPRENGSEILLMDEPDAYLSSQAQQDLLKVFDAFAHPENPETSPSIQVLYVTHSPFLIDKNRPVRIRVLEKGVEEEGTRVVKNAVRNHYEPLRSSLGAFVGETAFIGNCNIVVEGISDQVLLAGTSSYLRHQPRLAKENLDLNNLTIVPAGSASQVPYIVYLTRGRDAEKPAVVAILDSDKAGKKAHTRLQKCLPEENLFANEKELLPEKFIVHISELVNVESDSGSLLEIEDLIPLNLYLSATKRHLESFGDDPNKILEKLTDSLVLKSKSPAMSLFDMVAAAIKSLDNSIDFEDKLGPARRLVDWLQQVATNSIPVKEGELDDIKRLEKNMIALFTAINLRCALAMKERAEVKISGKIKRLKKSFNTDHPGTPTKEACASLLQEIRLTLDHSKEANTIAHSISDMFQEHMLDSDLLGKVANPAAFREALERLQYTAILETVPDNPYDGAVKAPLKLTNDRASQAPEPATEQAAIASQVAPQVAASPG